MGKWSTWILFGENDKSKTNHSNTEQHYEVTLAPCVVMALVLVVSLLMVCEISYFHECGTRWISIAAPQSCWLHHLGVLKCATGRGSCVFRLNNSKVEESGLMSLSSFNKMPRLHGQRFLTQRVNIDDVLYVYGSRQTTAAAVIS